MQGGDISNRLAPRWLVVFEGVIGRHASEFDRATFDWWCKMHAPKKAVETFQADSHSTKVLWDLTWRQDYKFDVVTFLPGRCVEWVEKWLDRHNVPAANVYRYPSPAELAAQLAYMPDVQAVVHADDAARFTYGDRGVLVSNGWSI